MSWATASPRRWSPSGKANCGRKAKRSAISTGTKESSGPQSPDDLSRREIDMEISMSKGAWLAAIVVCLWAVPIGAARAQDALGVERLTGTLGKIKKSNTVTIGFRDASVPFSYLNAARQPVGYSI